MSYGLIKILMIDQGTFLSTYKHRWYNIWRYSYTSLS